MTLLREPHLASSSVSRYVGNHYAAVFIDFENVYYYLRNYYLSLNEPTDLILDMIRNLRTMVLRTREERVIVQKAYADFERLGTTPQGSLYLLGVETHNVLGTEHKNAADMRLCIDAMEILYTRPEINTFIFLAGDRDYIPVIQHLTQQARTVLAVAFKEKFLSGDLLQNVGEENFIDAEKLLSDEMLERFLAAKVSKMQADQPRTSSTSEAPKRPVPRPNGTRIGQPSTFARSQPITNEDELEALELLLRDFGHHSEVFLSPYLFKLRNQMDQLADYQRKALISNLEDCGAIRVEKRQGEPHDYSVILINWNHETVQSLNPGM